MTKTILPPIGEAVHEIRNGFDRSYDEVIAELVARGYDIADAADAVPQDVSGEEHHAPVPDEPTVAPPPAPVAAAPDVGATDGGVPDGPVAEIVAWVDSDPDRAALALDAERARPEPRVTLVAKLEELVGGDA